MNRKSRSYTDDRRTFLKTLAAAGGAAAAVTMTGQSASAATATNTSSGADEPRGYRETAHIQTYYRTARL